MIETLYSGKSTQSGNGKFIYSFADKAHYPPAQRLMTTKAKEIELITQRMRERDARRQKGVMRVVALPIR